MIKRSTWIMVAIFTVLAGILIIYQRTDKGEVEEITPTEDVTQLFDFPDSEIKALVIENNAGKSVHYKQEKYQVWKKDDEEELIEPPSDFFYAIEQFITMRILNTVYPAPDGSLTGLDSPNYTLTLTLNDGRQKTIFVGNLTPTGNSYYLLDNDGNVRVVSAFPVDSLVELLED